MKKLVNRWLEDLARRGLRPATIEGRRRILERFEECGFSLEEFGKRLSRGQVYAQVQRSVVRLFLRFAGRREEAESIRIPKIAKPPILAPSVGDVRMFLLALEGNTPQAIRNRAMAELLYSAGMRACEVIRLRVGDLDLVARIARVEGKGGRVRSAPFGPSAAAWIAQYLEVARLKLSPRSDALFVGRWGRPLRNFDLCGLFARVRSRIATSVPITPHALRRAAASHCQERGMHLREIQEFLGHARMETTVRYTAIEPGELRRVVERAHPRGRMKMQKACLDTPRMPR